MLPPLGHALRVKLGSRKDAVGSSKLFSIGGDDEDRAIMFECVNMPDPDTVACRSARLAGKAQGHFASGAQMPDLVMHGTTVTNGSRVPSPRSSPHLLPS
jgi:hypothetical protein